MILSTTIFLGSEFRPLTIVCDNHSIFIIEEFTSSFTVKLELAVPKLPIPFFRVRFYHYLFSLSFVSQLHLLCVFDLKDLMPDCSLSSYLIRWSMSYVSFGKLLFSSCWASAITEHPSPSNFYWHNPACCFLSIPLQLLWNPFKTHL